jgi:hypothetical protein
MHRLEVQRAQKTGELDAAAVASLEAQVRETYRDHDRELSNPDSRRRFEDAPPSLDADQQQVLDLLQTDGLAVIPFDKLGDPALWPELAARAASFEARVESGGAAPAKAPKAAKEGKPGKPKKAVDPARALARAEKERRRAEKGQKKKFFLHRELPRGAELTLDDPWLRLAVSTRLVDVVNTYLRLWTKLTYLDQWYTVPGGSEAERAGSQRWHRDYNDQYLVKVFVYMTDVDEGSGPFEYVPGSARGGPYEHEWPWEPLGESYPDPEEFAQRIPASAARTLTAPAGTMILCNTSGFHRGGFATERRRILGVANYVSPAALASLVERNFKAGGLPPDLPGQVGYALT